MDKAFDENKIEKLQKKELWFILENADMVIYSSQLEEAHEIFKLWIKSK